MLQDHEIEKSEVGQELELDVPAASSPAAALHAKAGSLSGALVQRGRERSPRLSETSIPSEPVAAVLATTPVAEALLAQPTALLPRPAAPQRSSRWADALFAAACCVAFFASFLFVLRF